MMHVGCKTLSAFLFSFLPTLRDTERDIYSYTFQRVWRSSLSSLEAEAGGSLQVQGQPEQHEQLNNFFFVSKKSHLPTANLQRGGEGLDCPPSLNSGLSLLNTSLKVPDHFLTSFWLDLVWFGLVF